MDSTEMDMFPQVQETLLEFRAGKMIMEGKRVVPDTRKGLVRIGRGEEGLIHIQWLDRSNNNIVEDDQIIFPDEAIFEKINQPSSRVFVLKFHTDDRKLFFWMQEPNSENDTQLCTSVNFYLNQPLEFPGEEVDATGPQNSEDIVEEDISRAENLGGLGYGGEAASDVNSSGPVKLADLQRILSNIGSSGVDNTMDPDAGLGLGDILRPEFITPLIEELAFNQELASHLPEGQWSPEEIIELLQSPPFRQQVDSFTYVLRTGQIDLSQFGIDPSNFNFTVPSFLEALEDSVSRKDDELRSQTCNQSGDQMDESK